MLLDVYLDFLQFVLDLPGFIMSLVRLFKTKKVKINRM